MNEFLNGISFLFDGFGLLKAKGVKRYVIIPVFINIIFFIVAFLFLKHYMSEFNAWIMHFLPHWLQWLAYLLWVLFFVSFFILFVYTFMTIANLISAPFNSLLAEKVEAHLTGKTLAATSMWHSIKDVPRTLGRQLGILGFYLPRAILVFILFFVPIAQAVAPILWVAFNAWFLTLTYIDYPTDLHRVALREVRDWLKQNKAMTFGFGVAVLGMSLVPLVNLFVIPAAVAGATKFWLSEHKKTPKEWSSIQ